MNDDAQSRLDHCLDSDLITTAGGPTEPLTNNVHPGTPDKRGTRMSAQAIKTLRKAVNRPKIEEGTVVRLQVRFECTTKDYFYSALFTNGKWYSTSQRNSQVSTGAIIKAVMSQTEFEQVLQAPEVGAVAVATEWENL